MSQFPETVWPLVDLACEEGKTGSREHMGKLLETYWQPMYAHVRFKGVSPEKAEDLVQEFSMQLLENDLLSIADPSRGKFRTLLLTALDRFVVSKFRYDTAAKRAPEQSMSLNAAETDLTVSGETPASAAFDRAYAIDVIAQVLAMMKQECESTGELIRWEVFENRIVGPMLESSEPLDYQTLAENLGLKDEKAAMNLLVTGKRQFTRLLRAQVRDYVTRNPNIDHYIEAAQKDLLKSTSDPRSTIKPASELAERAVGLLVEEEIDSLKKALQATRGAPQVEIDSTRSSAIYKSGFLARLNNIQAIEPISDAYEWGRPDAENFSKDVLFTSILSTNLKDVISDQTGTIYDVIVNAEGGLSSIKAIKDWVNLQRVSRTPLFSRDLATVIYYAAIAAALVHFGERISSLQDHILAAGLNSASDEEWVSAPIRNLLQGAEAVLGNDKH